MIKHTISERATRRTVTSASARMTDRMPGSAYQMLMRLSGGTYILSPSLTSNAE
jgi:hypothetical protein